MYKIQKLFKQDNNKNPEEYVENIIFTLRNIRNFLSKGLFLMVMSELFKDALKLEGSFKGGFTVYLPFDIFNNRAYCRLHQVG